jgi:hypothetical protein
MQGRLLMIKLVKEPTHPEIDSGGSEFDDEESKDAEDLMAVPVHVLVGYSNPQTMRVRGYLKRQPVIMLIDTGNTNNFLDKDVSKRLPILVEPCD